MTVTSRCVSRSFQELRCSGLSSRTFSSRTLIQMLLLQAQDELHSAQPDLSAQERYEAIPTEVRRLFSHSLPLRLEWTFPYYAAALDSPLGQAIWSYLSGNPASRAKKGFATYFQVGKSAISTKIQALKKSPFSGLHPMNKEMNTKRVGFTGNLNLAFVVLHF